jgi:hypothetical protein
VRYWIRMPSCYREYKLLIIVNWKFWTYVVSYHHLSDILQKHQFPMAIHTLNKEARSKFVQNKYSLQCFKEVNVRTPQYN